MNDQTVYWLWIQRTIGFGSPRLTNITKAYTFAEDFYRAPFEEKQRVSGVHPLRYKLLEDPDLDSCRAIMDRCAQCGIDIISYGDSAYPELLRQIKAPPAVLFVRGEAGALSSLFNIAIVGTRNPSEKGCDFALDLANELSSLGACIVSGGAVGIDTQAHRGALRANGKTVCVLGCGHECGYLPKLDYVKRGIVGKGAVSSEYPPDMPPKKGTFPLRNRIISGISRGVAVVEAGLKSGSLITAKYASEQKKEIFAAALGSGIRSEGTEKLINEGAKVIGNAEDIIKEFSDVKIAKGQPSLLGLDLREFVKEAKRQIEYYEKRNIGISHIPDFSFMRDAADRTESDAKKKRRPAASAKKKSVGITEEKRRETDEKSVGNIGEKKSERESTEKKLPEGLSKNAALVMQALSKFGELHIDEISEKTELEINRVQRAMTELDLEDLVEALDGRRYRLKK